MKNILFFNTVQNKAWKNRALFLMLALVMSIGNAWGADSYYTGFKTATSGTGIGYVYGSPTNTSPTNANKYYKTEKTIEQQSVDLKESNATKNYYAWAKADRGSKFTTWTVASSNKQDPGIKYSTLDNTITITVTSNVADGTNTATATAEFSALTPSSVTCHASEYGSYYIKYSYEIATGDNTNGYTFKTEEPEQLIESGNSSYGPIELYPTDVVTLKVTTNTEGFEGWYKEENFNAESKLELLYDEGTKTYTYPVTEGATEAIYAKFAPSKTFYGKLTTQIASSSIGSGGKIYTSTIETANPAYTDQPSTTDATPKTPIMEATSVTQTYHLYAQPTDGRYVFIGWFNNAECRDEPLSNDLHYTYSMVVASENEENPTRQTLYAYFDLIKPYYLQVNALAADPLTGMVLVSKENSTNPDYMLFKPYSSATIVASATNVPPTATAYVYAEPSYGYSFEGWYADAACKTQRLSTANPYDYSTTAESTNAADPTRKNLYAKFTEATTVDIKYILPTNGQYTASIPTITESNGEYVWEMAEVYNSTNETTDKTVSLYPTSHLILSATPKEGYGVQSWTDGSTITTVLNTYQTTIKSAKTLGVTFEVSEPYLLKGTDQSFSDLQKALDTARDGSNKVVVVVKDACVPAGEYTIPSGVTLLVPYDKTDYKTVKDNNNKVVRVYEANVVPDCVITLTMAEGANIIVEGQLEVGGEQNNGGQTNSTIGSPRSHGKIKMHTNSTITLKDKSHLYCWGYIVGIKNTQGEVCGQGTILAEKGSAVHECLQIRDWKGGTASLPMEDNKERVFPVNQYYIQNIEVPITFNGGAKNLVSTGMLVSKGDYSLEGNSDDVPFVDQNSGLFQLSSDAQLKRDYIEDEDRIEYRLNGNAEFKELNFSLKVDMFIISSGVDIKSANYLLPVTNNMTLHIESGEMKVSSNILVSPGAEIFIHNNATVTTTGEMYVFDKEDWLGYEEIKIYPLLYANETVYAATASGTKKQYIRKWDNVQDAKICVDGKLKILGPFYTTGGGADICSTDKGEVIFNTAASTAPSSVYQVINQTPTYVSKTANPAWLHNDEIKNPDPNNKYTLTAGAIKDDVFVYSKEQGRWLKNPKTITWNSTGGTCAQTETVLPSGFPLGVLPVATKEGYTFKGWFTAESGGTQISTETIVTNDVTYYAQWTLSQIGNPLDIVDADGTNLTINANGWASSGWPYKIKDKYCFKGVRAEDRTLTIPYSGELNADMPIVLKDKEGTVVSSHIYKVPFVYTGTENMNAMNENSIVFVKSGTTLQTTDGAKAKEIYVAPGAELKVAGTLTVGKLVLRTTPWQSAVLTIETDGSIAIADGGQVYYSRIAPNKSTIKDLQNTEIEYNSARYYQFGLPLSCDIEDVTMSNTGKFGASNTPYGNTWLLKSYSESKRAENGISSSGDNWEALESTGTITAGVGYEMFSNSNYYREFYFPVDLTTATTQVSVQYTGGTIGAEHNGWNIITSPLTSRANVPIIDPATAFKVCWLQADGSYEQKLPTVIPPAIPFSCQVSAEEGTLKFDANFTFVAQAPRKQSAAEALTETEWVHLDIYDTYGEGDETSLFVHPTRFEQTYKIGIDVAKQSLTAARPIIYSTHAYGDMAFAGIADSLLENGIDLVVYSPAAQELTFSLRENKFLHRLEYLWLADNETGTRTDLLMDDYTCRANAGTTKGRFVLNGRFKAPQISTGIGNTQTDYNIYAIGNNIAISGVEQGTPIYVFDAVGHMIYTTAATSDEVIVPAPCAGVYMLTIGGQTAKLVVNQ